jgi:DNA-binding response OmpR family regulator
MDQAVIEAEAEGGAEAGAEADGGLRPAISDKLLIIDDDRVHRMVIARIARQAGYEVGEAATYDAACRLVGEESYACVTLDLSLGEHGGLDVLQHLARIRFAAPTIVVSGSDDSVREEALAVAGRLGVNVCCAFGKPMNLSHLRTLLSEIRKRQVVGLTPRGA